ncbi:hypothetical protein [Pseudomonas extremaustralis]|uniref:hypothetical protein n=1 Tax=Pseudomonas extremaustralis TaxID=359110 RepID=UPI0023072D22|nr:hypothetical protein [Pseudomonas extremaustralis]MDB1109736.1 hypothetical protein [Pseudomonas extremaustralis]
MGLLTEMTWPKTTLLDLLNEAELIDGEICDVVHLELNSGLDYLIAVITGSKAEQAAELLERLRSPAPKAAERDSVAYTNDENIIDMVEMLQQWHGSRVEKLELIASAKPGTEIQALGPDGQPLVLTKEMRTGLLLGVDVALQMFRKLPLTLEENASDDLEEDE